MPTAARLLSGSVTSACYMSELVKRYNNRPGLEPTVFCGYGWDICRGDRM